MARTELFGLFSFCILDIRRKKTIIKVIGLVSPNTAQKGREDPMNQKQELAMGYFREGYSCAQAVLLAFCDETGLSKQQAAMLAAPFGGGMGRLREVCGAFSAALMVMGLLEGVAVPDDEQAKADQYAEIQRWARVFEEQNGSIICRQLLKDIPTTQGSIPQPRTEEYYAQRPCMAIVGRAAAMTDTFLKERQTL